MEEDLPACVLTHSLTAVTDHGPLEEGESQLMMGRMLPILQDLTNFVNRIYALVKNIVWQLAAFHNKSRSVCHSAVCVPALLLSLNTMAWGTCGTVSEVGHCWWQ